MVESDRSFLTSLDAGVLTLSFNRPEFGNAMPADAIPEIIALLRGAARNPKLRCVLVRGEGRNFSAGGDVKAFARSLEQSSEERSADYKRRLDVVAELVLAYDDIDVPIIATCRGGVAGAGLMYTLGADVVLADPTVVFIFAHQRLGLSPDAGVSWLLPKVVGVRLAREMILCASKVDAAEAVRVGLVSRLLAPEQLEEGAAALAACLARAPQQAIRTAKRLLRQSGQSLETAVLHERDAIASCVADPDFEEGVKAFIEKRSPRFPSGSLG